MPTLAGKDVGDMGFGLMQLTWTPHPVPEDISFAAMKAAADAGATAWSSATFYGNPGNEMHNLHLVASFFKKYPEYIDKIVIVVKTFPGKPDEMRETLMEAKSILGEKEIDVYSVARMPPGIDKEAIWNLLKSFKEEGLIREVGASELGAASMEQMHKIVPVACNEIEVSLWSWAKDIQDAVAWSKANKVPVFAYSPLARGFISRTYKSPEDIPEGDMKRRMPRFQGQAFYDNLKLVDQLDEIAKEKGVTTPQLALAWVCDISPYNIPIPGSSNPERIRENVEAGKIKLDKSEMDKLNSILESFEANGGRYDKDHTAWLMQ